MVTLRQLDFLVALSEELNFSRAAARCQVTQSTLSTGLRDLEERLGVLLVERSRRTVMMTEIGTAVAARARGVLLGAREIEAMAEDHKRPDKGDLRLGVIPTIGPYLLPRTLPLLKTRLPGLRLFLREEITDSLLDGVETGRLDLALMALPFPTGALETMTLFEDGYHLARPLPGQQAATSDERLMLLEQGHCLHRHALEALPGRTLREDPSFAATSLTTLVAMVGEGLGVTLLPDLAVCGGVTAEQRVALTPLPGARPRRIALVWRATSPRKAVFRKIAAGLIEARSALSAPVS
jgi:LysR family hydrogen peroxide-inducible transcriptional activator